jgi:gas vesicle protein
MKKIIPTEEQIIEIKKMFVDELKGLREISNKFGWSTFTISRILKENNVIIKGSGRKFLGGRKESYKRNYHKHKEKKSEYHKKWSEQNKEHLSNYIKEYRENNVDKIRQIKRDYERNRKATDPIYKLINNFRTAIYQVLKENNVKKNGHYFDILKYSPEDLIVHLEKQFDERMSWDNYGEWHVDHIKPISSFNIQEIGDNEFIECWSLNNLQPLWGDENIRKSNKLDYL